MPTKPKTMIAAVRDDIGDPSTARETCVISAMVEHPIAGINASFAGVTKGGLEATTRSLALDTAADEIAVLVRGFAGDAAPGLVRRAV
jgi:hypothetical protein